MTGFVLQGHKYVRYMYDTSHKYDGYMYDTSHKYDGYMYDTNVINVNL